MSKPFRFFCRGVDLAHPVDAMPEGMFPILRNVRVTAQGELDVRQGLDAAIAKTELNPVHSFRRFNNDVDSTFARMAGVASKVYMGTTGALAQADTGYSGRPLSIIPFRPNRSPNPFMYVGDRNRFRKFARDGSNYAVGIVPPVSAPKIGLGEHNFVVVANFESAAGWAVSGTAGAISTPDRFNTTIAQILYDNGPGSNGWCSIVPTVADNNLQSGAQIILNAVETSKIREVHQAITTTTIDAILYEAGVTGLCSIVLHDVSPNLEPNAIIDIAGEYVRVLEVVMAQDGIPAFRCSTTLNHVVGAAVTGHVSFRCYAYGAFVATNTITAKAFSYSVTKGIGTIAYAGARKFDVINPVGLGGRPVTADDYLHISVMTDNPANLVEGRILLDISDGTFTKSFFYKPFRASDLTPNVQGQLTYLTTQQLVQTRDIVGGDKNGNGGVSGSGNGDQAGVPALDTNTGTSPGGIGAVLLDTSNAGVPDVVTGQMIAGNSQWTEFRFKLGDLIRVGSDQVKSLANVVAVGIQINATATVQVLLGGWWLGGTYGVDVLPSEALIQYATRYRDSRTGAKSNPSPFTRIGLDPNRERMEITLTASSDPQVDSIDLLRFGGGLNRWKVVGNYPNANATVNDDLSALAVQSNEEGSFDDYQPFPISDLPRMGTCQVTGTLVKWLSGDKFNLNWVPGSQIIVNGIVCSLYGTPLSDTLLRTVESAGIGTGLAFTLPEPTITAQPLPALWSFGGQGIGTYLMGVGDPYNPGFLRWCKGNDPDTASDTGNLEITSPAEPLMNGLEYDGRGFVFSSERLFAIFPNFGVINYGGVGQTVNSSGGNAFTAQVVVSNSGLFGQFGFCVTPHGIAWVARDGINLWAGGETKSLTEALYPLFPHGGAAATAVNGFNPPDFSDPDKLRLFFADTSLFFVYPDSLGTNRCMRFDFRTMGWYPYDFTPEATLICMEEGEDVNVTVIGGKDGNVYPLSSSTTDVGTPIACQVRIPALDMEDPRTLKYFTDSMLDHNGTLTCAVGFNNYSVAQAAVQLNQTARGQSLISLALNDGDNLSLYFNIGLDLNWIGNSIPFLFQPNAIAQPMLVQGLVTQYTDHGIPGYSHEKEAWIGIISTSDAVLDIYTDGVKHSFTIPSTKGRYARSLLSLGPLKAKAWLYRLTCPTPCIPFPGDILVMVKRWGADSPFMPYHPFQANLNTLGEGRAFIGGIPTGM